MFCAISGTSPLHPVVSTKSGLVYEKDLILKYLKDNDGKDPITGEELLVTELVDVKTAPSAPAPPPRPPTLSSVPALLHVLQNEWDATMLECLELRKQNASLRQELSHALYKEDAAMRVLARIMRERDEAREALGSVRAGLGGAGAANGGPAGDVEMQEAGQGGLSAQVVERIDTTASALSATRKKRKAPPGYAAPADVKTYGAIASIPSLHSTKPPGITCLEVTGASGELLVTGGMDKNVQVYDRVNDKVIATLKGHTKKVNAVAVINGKNATVDALPPFIAAASADTNVRLWAPSDATKAAYAVAGTLSGHSADVTSLSVHPSNTLLLSGSLDGTWAVHDLADPSGKPTTILTVQLADVAAGTGISSIQWHPDGQILGAGCTDGAIRIYDVKTSACVASFPGHEGLAVTSVSFSENGYLLASIAEGSTEVKLWDLRKMSNYHTIALPEGYKANVVAWDFSAQLLAVVGTDLRVWQNKTWEQLVTFEGNAAELTGVAFVKDGQEIVVGGLDRTVRVLGKEAA